MLKTTPHVELYFCSMPASGASRRKWGNRDQIYTTTMHKRNKTEVKKICRRKGINQSLRRNRVHTTMQNQLRSQTYWCKLRQHRCAFMQQWFQGVILPSCLETAWPKSSTTIEMTMQEMHAADIPLLSRFYTRVDGVMTPRLRFIFRMYSKSYASWIFSKCLALDFQLYFSMK